MLRVLLAIGFSLGFASVSQATYPKDHADFVNESAVRDDADLVRANRDRRQIHYLRASNMEVVKVMPDDTNGSEHQRFYVKLSNGDQVFAVYSLESGRQRVPIRTGVKVGLGGEYKWTRFGGLMHWLHEDVRDRRPDGYVELGGVRYGNDSSTSSQR